MFNKKMKPIIKQAIEYNIHSLETKLGYNNADILRISSYSLEDLNKIKVFANLYALEYKIIKEEKDRLIKDSKDLYHLFCVFSEDKIDLDYYELKL